MTKSTDKEVPMNPEDKLSQQEDQGPPAKTKWRYPNAKHFNVKNDLYMPARKPPKSHYLPPTPEIGSLVWLVDKKTFNSRRANLDDLYKRPSARVVGESFFAGYPLHERLLQLRSEETSEHYYVRESEVILPHIMDR